jgi:hypothetical protein
MVDWTDPCARFDALNTAYYRLVSGQAEVEISTRTTDAEEKVRFTAANLDTLRAERDAAEIACAVKNGLVPARRRSAISLGARRGGRY